ncbi:MAG: PAS domain S-box protein [Gemmatimonadales bacterium]|nr:PAS domain S-box protein [Gemmatimonadales bacterium]
MSVSPTLRLRVGLGAALLMLTAMSVLAYVGHQRDTEDGYRLAQAASLLTQVEAVSGRMAEAETNRRGFVITGDTSFLRGYRTARSALTPALVALHEGAAADARARALAARLDLRIAARTALLQESVDLELSSPGAHERQRAFTRAGQAESERLRALFDSLRARGGEIVAEREAAAARSARVTTRWILLLDLIAFVLALGVARLVAIDFRRRRRTLRALRESEERYRTLAETAHDGIFILDRDHKFQYVNGFVAALFGRAPTELVGKRHRDLFPAEAAAKLSGDVLAVLDAGQPLYKEEPLPLPGRELWVGTRLVPMRDDDGAVTGVMGITRDVSDRRRTEAELLETRERLQRAVEAGRVGLWDWDIQANTVTYSAEWKRQIGYGPDELSDLFSEWESRVHPEDLPALMARLNAYLVGPDEAYESEFRFRHKDGSYRRILARGSAVRDASGVRIRMYGSHIDITDQVELQHQMEQAQKMESVGRLAGGIAHDFNNLLTVINSSAELASAGLLEGDERLGDLQAIRDAGDRAVALTRQLLAFSRRQVVRPASLDLNQVVAQSIGMLRRLIGEDIELRFQPATALGVVKADRGHVEQVIMNLAVNARDAMPRGGTLTITTADVMLEVSHPDMQLAAPPGPYVMIDVTDTGVGMDAATRARVFEPFFTTKGPGKGTGLGLSTVYGIVQQGGGALFIRSEPGQGTTFRVCLPRVDAAIEVEGPSVPMSDLGGSETILVVEDDDGVRSLASRVLGVAGYRVLAAPCGEEALRLLSQRETPVDLLLTDVVMPAMNGRELMELVRARHGDIAVIYTSGYTDDTVVRLGLVDDPTRFLAKPYTAAELRRKVRVVLELRRGR